MTAKKNAGGVASNWRIDTHEAPTVRWPVLPQAEPDLRAMKILYERERRENNLLREKVAHLRTLLARVLSAKTKTAELSALRQFAEQIDGYTRC